MCENLKEDSSHTLEWDAVPTTHCSVYFCPSLHFLHSILSLSEESDEEKLEQQQLQLRSTLSVHVIVIREP